MARLYRGTYANISLSYRRHPTFAPVMKNSLNLLFVLNLFF